MEPNANSEDLADSQSELLEVIGPWTEVKQEIIEQYARAYSTILNAQTRTKFFHVYIDAFAGAGRYLSRAKGIAVPGSPQRALDVTPPFRHHYFIDLDSVKVTRLEALARDRSHVTVLHGDCNTLLVETVLPQVRYDHFRRGLCILDPYGLQLKWSTVMAVAQARSVEIFLNFPTMDMNRNVLWNNPTGVSQAQGQRLSMFWGDQSWRDFYQPSPQLSLWGERAEEKQASNDDVAEAFRRRLRDVAGFSFVPPPLPMRNGIGRVLYYLFFASHQRVAADIIEQVFAKYRKRG